MTNPKKKVASYVIRNLLDAIRKGKTSEIISDLDKAKGKSVTGAGARQNQFAGDLDPLMPRVTDDGRKLMTPGQYLHTADEPTTNAYTPERMRRFMDWLKQITPSDH